jgi:hypothetical protein
MAAEIVHPSVTGGPPNVLGVPVMLFTIEVFPFVLWALACLFFQYWLGMVYALAADVALVGFTVFLHKGNPSTIWDWAHRRVIPVHLEATSNLRSVQTPHK